MTESPIGGAPRSESTIFGASGILGVNNLQRAVDGFDKTVEKLTKVVNTINEAGTSFRRGSSAAGAWNSMSNWSGGNNGGNATFNGQPTNSGSGGSTPPPSNGSSTDPGAHAAPGPTSFTPFSGIGGSHRGKGNGLGKAMYAMGAVSKIYQDTTQSTEDSNTDSMIYAATAFGANFGQANSLFQQGVLGRSMFNYTGWANSGADAAQAMSIIGQNAGGLINGASGRQMQGFVKGASYVNPLLSGAQAAKMVTSFYQPQAYVGLRQVGVQTLKNNGQRQSPTQIANQVLNQVDPGQTVRTPQAAAQLVTDPFSPLNLMLGNWVSNGLISGDEVKEIKDQIQAILRARQQGISASQLSHALSTRDSSSASRSLLQKAGLDSSLQREKDKAAAKRQPTADRLPEFNDAVGQATKSIEDFTNAVRDATSSPDNPMGRLIGGLQGEWRGMTSGKTWLEKAIGIASGTSLLGMAHTIGSLGGNNETRMSVGGALTGVTVSSQPHNAGRAAMGGAMAGGPANVGGSGGVSTHSSGSGGHHHHGGSGGRQHMILPAKGPLGEPFGAAGSHWASGHHTGQDIECPTGTPVHAPAAGHVIFAGWDGPYGKLVKIDHGGGIVSYMAHNSRLVAHVGAHVRQGQLIAYSGATGNVTGPHCHFEVRVNGVPVNPMQFVNGSKTVPAGGGASSGSTGGGGTSGSGTNSPNGSGKSYDGSSGSSSDSSSMTPSVYSGMAVSGVGSSELDILNGGLSGGGGGLDFGSSTSSSGTNGGGGGPGDNGAGGGPKSVNDGSSQSSHGGITHVTPGVGNPNSNVALGKDLARGYGWGSGKQWTSLYKLWMGESGWRTTADNPTSSAYGIPQAMLSLHKMPIGYYDHKTGSGSSIHAYGGDPRIQIQWGLAYIKGAYGNPANAYSKWLSRNPHWYDKGAWEVPEDEDARIHKGEMVVPKKEADQIREILVNGNPYGVMSPGKDSRGGVTLQFNPGSVVIKIQGTGSSHADGAAIGKAFADTLAQNDRILALMNGVSK